MLYSILVVLMLVNKDAFSGVSLMWSGFSSILIEAVHMNYHCLGADFNGLIERVHAV
jgi:hypothetical protein